MVRLSVRAGNLPSTSNAKLVSETIATYDRTAEDYAADSARVLRKTQPMAECFINHLRGKLVLEIGCGPGYDAKYFSEHGLALTAIDLSGGFRGDGCQTHAKGKSDQNGHAQAQVLGASV